MRTEGREPADSEKVRFRGFLLTWPGALNLEELDNGAEASEALFLVFRLLVDLSDGVLAVWADDIRSGMTTTGIPPCLIISRRDLMLDDRVLMVVLLARLWSRLSGILSSLCISR